MQELQVIEAIDNSYEQAIHANMTLPRYLESALKVKETQSETLSLVGLQGADSIVTDKLLRVSELVKSAVKKGKEIDIRSDDALLRIEEISNQIKNFTY